MMRVRTVALLVACGFAGALSANEVILSIGGSVGNFRTDTRIFNPSFDKDITVAASYWPSGNVNNTSRPTINVVIPKRTMKVYDDVVQSLFGGDPNPLGAVVLQSQDDVVATQRIYADESAGPQNGTLGQFVPGLDRTAALQKGVLLQLKASGVRGQKGTFRTNVGLVNPNTTAANVTLKLFDKNNAQAASIPLTLQPKGVVSPSAIAGLFGNPQADLSNAWVGFTSDQPIFVYGSVLDNGSEDPTFITASVDSGIEPVVQVKTVTIVAANWNFSVTGTQGLKKGDQVKLMVSKSEGTHGFRLTDPQGNPLVTLSALPLQATEIPLTLSSSGNYFYVCTNSGCGEGHFEMTGEFQVEP